MIEKRGDLMGNGVCHEGHRNRHRERLIRSGADSMYDHELIELLLFYSIPRVNTNETAHHLINDLGGIEGILKAEPEKLLKIKGVGNSTVRFIRFVNELAEEYGGVLPTGDIVPSVENLAGFFRDHLINSPDGLCMINSLENSFRHFFFSDKLLDSDEEAVEIVDMLVRHDCENIAIGINHRSRPVTPDNNDFEAVRILTGKFTVLGITLYDCFLINSKNSFSFRRSGALEALYQI